MKEKASISPSRSVVYAPIPSGAEALVMAGMAAPVTLYLTVSDLEMARKARLLSFFAPDAEIIEFPAWDSLPYDRVSPNPAIVSKRISALSRMLAPASGRRFVVSTVNAALQRVPEKEAFSRAALSLAPGSSVPMERVLSSLEENGYIRNAKVMEPGEYAVRGSIVDIFPPGQEEAVRLDYFGDSLESIKLFDPLTQVSSSSMKSLSLLPASEIPWGEAAIARFRRKYREVFGAVTREDPLYEAVSEGRKYPGFEHWLPLFHEKLSTLFDYLPGALVCLDHLADEAAAERREAIEDFHHSRADSKISGNYNPVPPDSLFMTGDEWEAALGQRDTARFSQFASHGAVNPGFRKILRLPREAGALSQAIEERKVAGARVVISCFSQGSLEHVRALLKNEAQEASSWPDVKAKVSLAVLPLESGFEDAKTAFIAEQDIFGERLGRAARKKRKAENFLAEAANLAVGELIVHEEHGIGRFAGLETLEVNGASHDMLKLLYEGDDRLFVPVENIGVISRYGAEDEGAKLDKLGGVSWQSRKSKLRERIKVAAEELLKIAALRKIRVAPEFSAEENAYQEFCNRFPYTETEDQLSAIEDIERDLASGQPMDRLICGDVGFGKTEVALRAAFLAASGGCQVAVVAPTTLLSRQHFKTFSERFEGMPFRLRQLSRMVSARDAAETREMLASGEINIVIGTHAVLSEGVEFKNLGLVIIDEEQHFGVAQKERLKKLRAEAHILSLSATPIPRSLQMAMSGVRELSIIATPPVDRLAVRTFVMPFDPVVIREAIVREHNRGGRVFYVAPRISDLDEIRAKVSALVPEVKMGVAHGKMPPAALDKTMNEFFDGAFEVLVSTAIVESGLDISVANTMIIHRADMFGLSQLYQLRGRVGRGKTRAYAYLTLPHGRDFTRDAMKRLEVMQSLDTLGAGFTVASHDMDIRGFGNLLGEEQTGHVREVGVELYQHMLEEAVASAKAEKPQEEGFNPDINVSGLPVMIPEEYIADLSLRLGLYRRAGDLKSAEEVDSFAIELTDRFGKIPLETANLLDVLKLKILCRKAGIAKLDTGPKGVVISFQGNKFGNPEALLAYAARKNGKIRPDHKLVFPLAVSSPAGTMPVLAGIIGDIGGI